MRLNQLSKAELIRLIQMSFHELEYDTEKVECIICSSLPNSDLWYQCDKCYELYLEEERLKNITIDGIDVQEYLKDKENE